jgi:PleD family two-component response regulator
VQACLRDIDTPVDLETSTSIGLSTWRPDETTESVLAHADAALYQAKLQGRNRIASSTLSTLPDAL